MSSYFLLLLALVISCHCQISQPYITEPKLTTVVPLNSTALTVTWQFADVSIDRSDLIRISIVFYEYFYGYNRTYASNNYTFTPTNKTITNLTRNFELVNAYYYVCFSSNSTINNVTQFVFIANQCILTRTCLRSNTACPGPGSLLVIATVISSTSFQISFLSPNDLPYAFTAFSAQLINNGQIATALSATQNDSYTNRIYQFTGLQPQTTYTANSSFTYTILNNIIKTNVTILTVTTSSAWKLLHLSDFSLSILLFSVIFFFPIKSDD